MTKEHIEVINTAMKELDAISNQIEEIQCQVQFLKQEYYDDYDEENDNLADAIDALSCGDAFNASLKLADYLLEMTEPEKAVA